MSKLSFRARALDASKPIPIYHKDDLSDLQDYSVLNRAVPQMPSGMEKEEETEHHLQRAISAQQVYGDAKVMVIPVPEADISYDRYENLYKRTFTLPKHYVHSQAQALNSILEQEKPDYDMDSEDERWVKESNKRVGLDVTSDQFEEMVDRLEKSCGNQIVTLQEAKLLLKEDDDVIKAVYDYWTKKRLRNKASLLFQVKHERRDGSSINDSYVAFRRRTEKMQTRKNRKNDETSYEKMLKLRRELSRAVTILEMIKRREKSKRELLHLTLEIVEKRYQVKDYDGKCIRAVKKEFLNHKARAHYRGLESNSSHNRKKRLPSGSLSKNKQPINNVPLISRGELERGDISKKLKKKRPRLPLSVAMTTASSLHTKTVNARLSLSNKFSSGNQHISSNTSKIPTPLSYQDVLDTMTQYEFPPSSDEDSKSPSSGASPSESFDPKKYPDGLFTFRKKPGCSYHAPRETLVGDWPWMSDPKHRYSLTSLSVPDQCIGFTRRRVGRGGRVLLDRAYHPYSSRLEQLDLKKEHTHLPPTSELQDLLQDIKENHWPHYIATKQTSSSVKTEEGKQVDEKQFSWSASHSSSDQGRYMEVSGTKGTSNTQTTPKKHRSTPSKHSHRKAQGSAAVDLDKSFAMSALLTVTRTTAGTVTSTTHTNKISRPISHVSQTKVGGGEMKLNIPSMQRCVTCGAIVNLTSTVSDSKTNLLATNRPTTQHRVLPVTLSLATSLHQSSGQRTTVLPATVTVSMSKAGGGTHTTGVPALLRISSSGAVVGGTMLYPQQPATLKAEDSPYKARKDVATAANAGTTPDATSQIRRTLTQRTQRAPLNVNFTLPANVLASITPESSGSRATQSAPNSPRSYHAQSGDAVVGTIKGARLPGNTKTISLNLTNLTTPQASPLISTTYATSGPVNQIINAGRTFTIAGNMLKFSNVLSVALPQTTKPSSSNASSSSVAVSAENAVLVGEGGNIVLTKMDENRNKSRNISKSLADQSLLRTELRPMTITSLNNSNLKKATVSNPAEEPPGNRTAKINHSSQPKADSESAATVRDPLATVVTVATNAVPVKSSGKPTRPMEVT